MSKRLIIAIALSFLVMTLWARLTQQHYPIERQGVRQEITQPAPILNQLEEKQAETLVSAISHGRELVFSLPSASLTKIVFSQFGNDQLILEKGLYLNEPNLIFTQKRLDSDEAIFIHQDAQKRITKHFNYSDPDYGIKLDIKIENLSEQPLPFPSSLILGVIDLSSRGLDARYKEVFVKEPAQMRRLNPAKKGIQNLGGEFFGFRDRYFCAILIPVSYPEALSIIKPDHTKSQIILSRSMIEINANQIGHLQYNIYLGPQQVEMLKSFHNGAAEVVYYGFFDPISKLLLNMLRFFSRLTNNWGLAIIILSIFIFFILFPLFLKQMRSTKAMQHLQPKMEELRRIYKDNPQKLNKEMIELYRTNKINPLGGCLPMLGQIPIFFSLYQALMRSLELKGANFLWIKDLSQPDRLIASPEINILPILMAIAMFLQQKFMMVPTTGSSGEQQRLMSILFPVLFGFIFYRMPSGLVLYWFINSLLMFAYQMKIKVAHEPAQH